MKHLKYMCPVVLFLCLLCQGCSQAPAERVDASDVMSAARSLMVVLDGVAKGIMRGEISVDQVRVLLPEVFHAGMTTNKWLFGMLMDATNGKPIPKEAKETIMIIARRFNGMTAQDIISSASGESSDVTIRIEGVLSDISSKLNGYIRK